MKWTPQLKRPNYSDKELLKFQESKNMKEAKFKFLFPDSTSVIIKEDTIEQATIKMAANRIAKNKSYQIVAAFAEDPKTKKFVPTVAQAVVIKLNLSK